MRYTVAIEIEGKRIPVGSLLPMDFGEAAFQYDDTYLSLPGAMPISVHLPLQGEPFSTADTRCFFESLLPEGFIRKSVAKCLKTEETDYLSLLHGLGRECLGAIQITAEGEAIEPEAYTPLTAKQVKSLAEEGASYSAAVVSETHLSLAGATGKVGLYCEEDTENWFLPRETAPSTHIVKQSHVRYENIVINELLCQRTAARLGLSVPRSDIRNIGCGADGEVLFISRRYDRYIPEQAEIISGLPRPYRMHQEDFAQALGIPASEKYERNPEQQYLGRMAALLRQVSSNPVADLLQLWDAIVFHFLIGNGDAHIKNFSLLYSADLKTIRLAPLYDTVSTSVYGEKMRKLSLFIGNAGTIDAVSRLSFQAAAKKIGLGEGMAMQRFDALCDRIKPALAAAAAELVQSGFPQAEKLQRDILRTGGLAYFG